MAGLFDDLVPGGGGVQGPGAFDDLLPPPPPSPEQQRADRLRKIARAALAGPNKETAGADDLFSDSFTLGLMRPVGGLAQAAGGELGELFGGEPAGFGERYKAATGAYDDMLDEARANSGKLGTVAGVAGSLTAGGPARGVMQAPSILRNMTQAGTLGAVEGAARNSDSLQDAALGAAKGAALSSATAGVVGTALQQLPGFRARRAAARQAARGTPTGDLRAEARALYQQLDQSGTAYNSLQANDFIDTIMTDLRQNGWSPQGVHSSLNGIVGQIEALRDNPMSLEQLQMLREQIGSEAGAIEPQVRRIAGRILGNLDGFVQNVTPAMSQMAPDQIAPTWQRARQLWRAANTAEDIGWRIGKAENRAASTNSGGNVENAIRQNIRQVLDKAEQPRRWNPYSPEEIAQMRRVVEGTPGQNILRSYGNRFGGSGPLAQSQAGGLATGAGLGGIMSGQEPTNAGMGAAALYGGLWGTGWAARKAAAGMAQDEADTLMRLITTGSTDAAPSLVGPLTHREYLARLAAQAVPARVGATAGWLGDQ